MKHHDTFGSLADRIRLSMREIAVAIALTVAAATFLVTALWSESGNGGSPIAVVEQSPEGSR
jgi:hypothetical protein